MPTKLIKPPYGYDEIIEVFSLPPEDKDLRIMWEKENLETIPFPWGTIPLAWGGLASKIRVHKKVADVFQTLFEKLYSTGYYGLIKDYGGAYNYRKIRGSDKLSTHSFGISWDVNVKENGLGSTPFQPCFLVEMHEILNFTWGGRWSRLDGMHFQYCDAY